MLGHMHLLAQVLSPVMSSMYMCVSPRVHLSHSLLRSVLHHPLLFFLLMHFELHTEFDNLIAMQNLRTSANKVSNDAYDVSVSLTSYEPNDMVFNELGNSQGSFSYITPSSDLDLDDPTLGKLLTEAHREYADYRSPEGVSVSQSSLSVVFDRTGKPVGERNIDQSIGFGVPRNTYSAHSKFSEITQAEKMVDRTGKLVGESSSNAQITTLFDEQRQIIIAEYFEKVSHHELQAARAEEERRILQEELWRQKKELKRKQVDLQKTFSRYTMCIPNMLGGPSLRRGDTKEGLNIPSRIG